MVVNRLRVCLCIGIQYNFCFLRLYQFFKRLFLVQIICRAFFCELQFGSQRLIQGIHDKFGAGLFAFLDFPGQAEKKLAELKDPTTLRKWLEETDYASATYTKYQNALTDAEEEVMTLDAELKKNKKRYS